MTDEYKAERDELVKTLLEAVKRGCNSETKALSESNLTGLASILAGLVRAAV
jgi:hypothetical protein